MAQNTISNRPTSIWFAEARYRKASTPSANSNIRRREAGIGSGGHLNRGKWPKLESAWGNSRTFLQHKAGDNPAFNHRGKNDFSIHGGSVPGSAGCVDLTDQMDAFADFYKKTGEAADLIVSYPEYQNDIYPDPALNGGASPDVRARDQHDQEGQNDRWDPDPASQNRWPFGGISLRDALRFLE